MRHSGASQGLRPGLLGTMLTGLPGSRLGPEALLPSPRASAPNLNSGPPLYLSPLLNCVVSGTELIPDVTEF